MNTMSSVRVYFFVFLTLLGAISQFANCESTNCSEKSAPGSDQTKLSELEKLGKILADGVKDLKTWINKLPSNQNKNPFKTKSNDTNWCHFLDKLKELKLIVPGTKWCGGGNIASDENDLGKFKDIDACCREHDNCQYDIEAGDNLRNLQNKGLFTRSACSCDNNFYNCLKKVTRNSPVATAIGKTYFNILGPQCFICECPAESCSLDTDDTVCLNKNNCSKYKWINSIKFI